MLIPANTAPGQPRKVSEGIDPSSYIKTTTNKGIREAVDGTEYIADIDVRESSSELRALINRKIIILNNVGMNIVEIKNEIIPLIKSLSNLSEDLGIETDEVVKNDKVIKSTIFTIADNLGIPSDFTYKDKILKITSILELTIPKTNKKSATS